MFSINILYVFATVIRSTSSSIMKQSFVIFLGLVVVLTSASPSSVRYRRNAQNIYKMCVPQQILEECKTMVAENTKSNAQIVCIPARDRMDCLDKIQHRLADFVAVDPEDMYVGKNIPDQDFFVFEEIRTKEEPEAEFRYEAVAVIHKDLELNNLQGLKGLKSCHTGVGRNVGYKIPLTKLRKMGIIGGLNNTDMSPRENELKAFSELFSKACIVGKWSADPTINQKLKNKYSNLCALCEHPDICDYPDNFSGYEGALRCLSHNGGQIAWTKVIYVRKFFGLSVGTTPAKPSDEDPNLFSYLCPDGSRVPVTGTPCRWAARPWQGFMTNADKVRTISELRKKLENLEKIGEDNHAPWLEDVLTLNNKTIVKENKPIAPGDYLDKANYTDVIEREYGPPIKVVRMCVTSDVAMEKCRLLSKAAFSRDLRPRFDCIQEANIYGCLRGIRDNSADIVTLDASQLEVAQSAYNLKPILTESYEPTKETYAVAVVRKNSAFQNFNDLKGKRSCHPEFNNIAGYNSPIYTLMKLGFIKKSECPLSKALSEFFSGGSCMPGAKLQEHGLQENVAEKLCSLCVGSSDDNKSQSQSGKCSDNHLEKYYGYSGAFRCLAEDAGDVAFVLHNTVQDNTDGKSGEWAKKLASSDFELLCPKGVRAPIDQYKDCFLAKIPPNMIVTSNSKSDGDIDEIRHLLVSVGDLYSKKSNLFKLFGEFKEKHDVLFKDETTKLVSYDEEEQKTFNKILKETTC